MGEHSNNKNIKSEPKPANKFIYLLIVGVGEHSNNKKNSKSFLDYYENGNDIIIISILKQEIKNESY